MCQQCEVLYINGIKCHEIGCPLAYLDETRECKECGTKFKPEDRRQVFCSDHCGAIYNFGECNCDMCQELSEEEASR